MVEGGAELEELQRMNEGLSREVETLKSLTEKGEQEHSRQLQALRAEMRELGAKHRRDITESNTQYKVIKHKPAMRKLCT